MSALDPRELRAIFGRLMIQMSLVWAATMLGAAIAAKASDEFFWVPRVPLAFHHGAVTRHG